MARGLGLLSRLGKMGGRVDPRAMTLLDIRAAPTRQMARPLPKVPKVSGPTPGWGRPGRGVRDRRGSDILFRKPPPRQIPGKSGPLDNMSKPVISSSLPSPSGRPVIGTPPPRKGAGRPLPPAAKIPKQTPVYRQRPQAPKMAPVKRNWITKKRMMWGAGGAAAAGVAMSVSNSSGRGTDPGAQSMYGYGPRPR